jgi:2-haloacid dehalogenase
MSNVLAFDIYGTLIDTNGVVIALQKMIGDRATEFSREWRIKQLEYTFRRGLMQRYRDFSICTLDALNFTCMALKFDLSEPDKQTLLDAYSVLPVFPDVHEALEDLRSADYQLYAFSNGKADAVNTLLKHAGIRDFFIDVISTDELKTFKPNPAVYHHLLKRCNSAAETSWLISGNPFDVMGATSAGLKGIWLQRTAAAVFDPWKEFSADASVNTLTELNKVLSNA